MRRCVRRLDCSQREFGLARSSKTLVTPPDRALGALEVCEQWPCIKRPWARMRGSRSLRHQASPSKKSSSISNMVNSRYF